ncbi:protein kinase-like protein, putative [Trypanosoma cruzi]|uniref:Protein kinase-like protein, putative n=1 Tax=Trypanosoma cruzi (strain CL Brener) TaxID=353153 RepID=Q4DQP8_TRYCC|nr:protein kinase-like protein, putative [Trypanosoma cruzi]EAN94867.1 protein kinase-like protein, putative [Trypanosoma cruzi]|eukprot:XP_816718.1 protein kinase-like protein [Trypanosoma cruzi strain CL Brener]
MARPHCCCSHAGLSMLVVLLFINFLCASGAVVRFRGSVYRGLAEETLRRGGSTLVVRAVSPVFKGYEKAPLRSLLTEMLSVSYVVDEEGIKREMQGNSNSWLRQLPQLMEQSCIEVEDNGCTVRLTFHPLPDCVVEELLLVVPCLPPSIAQELNLSSEGEGGKNCQPGDAFAITPKTLLRVDADRIARMAPTQYITGNIIEIPLVRGNVGGFGPRIKVMEGCMCTNAVSALISGSGWDDEHRVFRFIAHRGGLVTLCYMPFPETLPHVMLEMGESINIAGPEGVSTEPLQIRPGAEFTGRVYGTNLSEHDVLMITEQSCNEFAVDQIMLPEFSLSSSTRAFFFGTLKEEGLYHVCYRREGSAQYINLATILVEGGDDAVTEKISENILFDEVTGLPHAPSVGRLQIERTGRLVLRQESLNVSSFLWSGGSIEGQGDINCTETAIITSQSGKLCTLSFILRNYGEMVIDVPQLFLEGEGALHNYGNLTITLARTGTEGVGSIRSRSHSNAIINRGGTIRVITVDQGNAVLCQTRIINTRGTLVLSGNLKITDMINEEKAQLVLESGARVSASDARLGGRIALLENSELKLIEDGAFVSATIKGNRSRIIITGESLLLDSINVTGDVATDIVGGLADPSGMLIAIYGVNYFGEGTHLNLCRTRFVANAGLVQLVIEGVLTAEVHSVVFSGNVWIQDNNIVIIYGKGSRYIVSKREEYSLVSLAVRENATLVALDVVSSHDVHIKCATLLSFFDYFKIDGRFLLRGCVTVPLGGIIGGSVRHLKLPEDAAVLLPCLAAADIRLPLDAIPPQRASLILGGETLLRNGAELALEEIIMRNAVLTGEGAVYVGAASILSIDRGSRISLRREWVLNASLTYVEGLLEADMSLGPMISGSLDVTGDGQVKLYSVQTSPCFTAPYASGGVRWASNPRVECYPFPLLSLPDSSTKALEREEMDRNRLLFALPPNIECSEEFLREEAQGRMMLQYFFDMAPFDPPPGVPTVRDMIVSWTLFVLLGFTMLYAFMKFNGLSWKQWSAEIEKEPPLRLTLSRSEFALHTMNYVVLALLVFNTLQTSMASIHPELFVPVGFMSSLRLRSMHLLMPHHRANSHVTMRLTMMVIFLWGFIEIFLAVMNRKDLRRALRGTRTNAILRLISSLNYALKFFFFVFSLPIRSLIIDSLACNTFLSELPTCAEARGNLVMSLFSFLVLCFMVPLGGFLFITPLKCDIHCRGSVLVAMNALSLAKIAMWKVFYHDSVLLIINNLLFQTVRVLYFLHSTPTAYGNINRLVIHLSFLPFFSHMCTLLHVIRVYLGFVRTCHDGETYFAVVVFLWMAMLVGMLWYDIIGAKDESVTTNNAAIDAIQRSIQQIQSRIQELQYEFLACASIEEKENVLNAVARLRIELLENQKRYRYEKYCHLAVFYVTGPIEESSSLKLPLAEASKNHCDGLNVEAILASRLSPLSPVTIGDANDSENGPLTQEEMENFSCGPALGSGSYGTVHLGILKSGRLVAVKYLSIQNSVKDALSQVQKEVGVLKKLSHPNIIRYFGCCTDNDYILLFMEFAVAGSLTSIVRNFTGLNESVIQFYTYQMLLGLRYLHQKGVVHRDIKGENILVDGFGAVKLADFGSSKILPGISDRSRAGCETLIGSPFWMAPEVIRNEPYGTKTDIWSVGCTVVEMLNGGTPPWQEEFENVYSLMYYVGTTDSIPKIPEDTSESCRDFLRMCFQRDTTKRPSSDELLQHPWLRDAGNHSGLLQKKLPIR